MTEVVEGELKEGDPVVTDAAASEGDRPANARPGGMRRIL
jgi:hypothetical protein